MEQMMPAIEYTNRGYCGDPLIGEITVDGNLEICTAGTAGALCAGLYVRW